MTQPTPRPLWHGRTIALLGILLVAVNLRTGVAAISPIAHLISGELHLDALLLLSLIHI